MLLQLSNNFLNKLQQKALSERLATVCTLRKHNTEISRPLFQHQKQSHTCYAYIYKVFSNQKKGVNRFRNYQREGVEEEISKSESQSFTLVSTLASVNA